MIWLTKEKLAELAAKAPAQLKKAPPRRILAFDVETPNNHGAAICSIGLTVMEDDRVLYTKEYLMNPEAEFDWRCIRVHGIRPQDVENEPSFPQVWPHLEPEFLQADLVIAHNAGFDLGVLKKVLHRYGLWLRPVRYADTVTMSRAVFAADMPNHKLGTLCECLGIDLDAHHAGSDSYGCAGVYACMLRRGADLGEYEKMYSFEMKQA
ncbi:MAG: 3'-5' exonuclease [Oscillospiraceae bacterium]|nr:3'-5' exonuclease [Oscillospiraceae bacterium]